MSSKMWIIWAGLLSSVFIYGIVGYIIVSDPPSAPDSEIIPMMIPIFVILSVMVLPLALFFRRQMLFGPLESGAFESIEEFRSRAFTPYVISWALGESVAIYGLILTLLSYNIDYYFGFAAWSIVLLALFRPNMNALEEKFYRRNPELRD